MIAVCEPQCVGLGHEVHNSGLLLALKKTYPNKTIFFWAEKTHIEAIKYCFIASGNTLSGIVFIPIDLASQKDSYLDLPACYIFYKKLLTELENHKLNHLILLTCHTNSLLVLKRLKSKFFPQMQFSLFLHEIIDYANKPFSFRNFYKNRNISWRQNFRYALAWFKNEDFSYIALSPFAKKNIKKNPLFTNLPLRSLHHPIIFNEQTDILKKPIITLATIGKGDHQSISILNAKLLALGLKNYQIKILGFFPDALNTSNHIHVVSNNLRITREEITSQMKNIDILLYFYDEDSYTCAQSGAFFETFEYNKPCLFLKNKHFSYYNNIAHPFAKECDNIDAMAYEIEALCKFTPSTIQFFLQLQENIAKTRKIIDPCYNPQNIKATFPQIL